MFERCWGEVMYRKIFFLLPFAAMAAATHAGDACNLKLGKAVFESKCVACHAFNEHKAGPRLDHLIGRRAGTVKGFEFSAALTASEFRWDVERLAAFLANPQEYAPGTVMAFRGIHWKEERDALVCYVGQPAQSGKPR
ncbi:cytochrome c family protein [Massilia sp. NR 4-1]|uniref:c-type cytochrome n=1 Tax=Massilia sp. NR 4-1 TaxID=1678028 RepID=UPI001681041B|nr:c-type cytochrome [Massilia sp. NR 4-1]